MYIKMTFTQAIIIIPGSWNKLIVAIPENIKPVIINQLPHGISANQPVNIQNLDHDQKGLDDSSPGTKEYLEKTYDYYYDCGELHKDIVKTGLKIFLMDYEGNLEAKVASDQYPVIHPAIELLKQSLTKAACLLSPKWSSSPHRFMVTQDSKEDEIKWEYLVPSSNY